MATQCGTVEVVSAFDPNAVTATNCSLSTSSTTEGGTVTYTVDVNNPNDNPATAQVEVSGSGFTETGQLNVSGNSTESIVFEIQFNSPGSYNLSADVVSASER